MASIKYRQRIPGEPWTNCASPEKFDRNVDYYVNIIKNYDEHPALSVYHIGFSRNSVDDRYFNHLTKRYKLVYVIEGSGWFNGLPVRSGQGFLVWQNRVNSMSADMRSPWKFIYVSFSGSLAEQFILRSGFPTEDTIFDIEDMEYVKKICSEVVYEPYPEETADLKMLSVLFDLLSLEKKKIEAGEGEVGSTENPHVLNAVRFISRNYRSQIGVAEIARAAHISEKYLRELFKSETGKSVQKYLTDTRLSASKTLLSNSKYNIGEVAILSGFGEYRNFARVFKEKFGITPGEYRDASINKE